MKIFCPRSLKFSNIVTPDAWVSFLRVGTLVLLEEVCLFLMRYTCYQYESPFFVWNLLHVCLCMHSPVSFWSLYNISTYCHLIMNACSGMNGDFSLISEKNQLVKMADGTRKRGCMLKLFNTIASFSLIFFSY